MLNKLIDAKHFKNNKLYKLLNMVCFLRVITPPLNQQANANMSLSLKKIIIYISALSILFFSITGISREEKVIHLKRGFTIPLQLPENAATIALGDPNLVGVNTLKPDFLMINGQETGTTSLTIIGKSNAIYQYQIVVGNDVYQLRQLLGLVDKGVLVDDVSGVIVLRGKVNSTAALTRVLSVADKFAGGNGTSSIKVISDHGGVLAGRINGNSEFDPPLRSVISQIGGLALGGGGGGQGGGGQGGGGQGGGGQRGGVNRNLQIMEPKGNLGQNLQRADVVSLANGKIISMIKVLKQPKVEMQLRIVAIDRNKTDRLGIDWRLDGNNVTIGSLLGRNVPGLPIPNVVRDARGTNATRGLDIGNSNLVTLWPNLGSFTLQTFIRALEEKGASKTLSEPLLTAVSGESSSFLVGGSLPIPVQTVVPGNINQNTTVVTNFTYIQFGLQLVVRPTVLENGKVSVVLDQAISQPNFANAVLFNGFQIPTFNTNFVSTITESESGETWAVAGLLTEEDTKNLRSIPWLSKIPMIGFLFQNKEDSVTRNELMILVNARVLNDKDDTTTSFDGIGNLYPENNPDANEPIVDKPLNQSNFPTQQLPLPKLSTVPELNRSKNKNNQQKLNNQKQKQAVQIINSGLNKETETTENGVKIIKPAMPVKAKSVKSEDTTNENVERTQLDDENAIQEAQTTKESPIQNNTPINLKNKSNIRVEDSIAPNERLIKQNDSSIAPNPLQPTSQSGETQRLGLVLNSIQLSNSAFDDLHVKSVYEAKGYQAKNTILLANPLIQVAG